MVERRILARLRNRRLFTLAELNHAIGVLLADLNQRPFKKLPGCRASAFAALDALALKPLPATPMELAQFRPRLIVPKSNPSVVTSALFVNSILENEVEDICFRVDDNCNTSIVDYENTKEDKNGKVDKKTVTDPKTRQSYQPFGHFCDIVRYFFCTVFSDRFRKFEKGAEKRPVTLGRNLAKHSW